MTNKNKSFQDVMKVLQENGLSLEDVKQVLSEDGEGTNSTSQVASEPNRLGDKETNKTSNKKKEDDEEKVNESSSNNMAETKYFNEKNYISELESIIKKNDPDAEIEVDEYGGVDVLVHSKAAYEAILSQVDAIEEIADIDVEFLIADETGETAASPEDEELEPEEMSDEEYNALPDSTWVSMYFIPKDKDALMDTEFVEEETVKESYDESSLYPDYEAIQEVKRRWKVNNKGKRRIKMKCKPGFKWTGKSCEKISGVELAKKRKAIIKMGRTKRAQGDRLKRRVKRLTAKARRFRKSFGLKN
jgi:DNA-binding transcriptional MerR regulator